MSNDNNFSFSQLCFKDEWCYENPDNGFCYKSGVIPKKLFYSEIKGDISIDEATNAMPAFSAVYESGVLTNSSFIRITDYSGVLKASIAARKTYASAVNRLNEKYNCRPSATFICGASLFIRASLRLIAAFVNQKLTFVDSVEEAFSRIS